MLNRLVAWRFDPCRIARICEHFACKLRGLLCAGYDDHLIGRTTRSAHRRGMGCDCFAQRRQSVASAVRPVVAAGSASLAIQEAIPDPSREEIEGRERGCERDRSDGSIVAWVTLQRLRALRQARFCAWPRKSNALQR
jgi:hypothetical protein